MLAENLENWAQQERQAGIEKGTKLGIEKTARNLLKLGVLSNEQIAEVTGLDLKTLPSCKQSYSAKPSPALESPH